MLPYNHGSSSHQIVSTHPMTTRSKVGVTKKRALLLHSEIQLVQEALSIPEWKNAMLEEYTSLMKNNTWPLVSSPSHRTTIGCH